MAELKVVKRTGEVVDFDLERIRNAIKKAMKAVGEPVPEEKVDLMVRDISDEVSRRFIDFHANVENIQDIVEKHLVKHGLYEIAKAYIIYRADRQRVREEQKQRMVEKAKLGRLTVKKRDGRTVLFDLNKVRHTIERVSQGYEKSIDPGLISRELIKNIYDGVSSEEIEKALILATVPFIEKDPAYSKVAARLYQQRIYKEVIGRSISPELLDIAYRDAFISGLKKTAASGMMDARMLEFDLRKLSEGLRTERDDLFEYLGLQTLYERYFIKIEEKRIELPQAFWMRVAMGLALLEGEKEKRALEFYEVLSTLRFVSSTPTLFHSGLTRPQLSSCYLTTVEDDLMHIFKSLGDHAQLSKWSGGLGNDWTPIRSTGAHIKSTNVESQGVIPFLKIANDVTVAINRSGKRRGDVRLSRDLAPRHRGF